MNEQQLKQLENTKFLIGELSNIQELYFDTLMGELDIIEGQEEWLFDYIFNKETAESFEEYLEGFGKSLEDVLHV